MRIVKSGAWHAERHMDRFYRRGSARVRCFKVMYNQLAWPFARRYLIRNKDIRVMHLRRENLLKVYVSTLLMSKRSIVQAHGPMERVWTHVAPQKAIAAIARAKRHYMSHDASFSDHPLLHLTYESLIDGQGLQEEAGRRICEFLGVDQMPMTSKIVKINPESLRDMVTNYDELADAVTRTEFAAMLD